MKNFIFNIPTKIIFRKGVSELINEEIPSRYSNILFVTDKTISEKTNIVEKIQKVLKNRNVFLFDEIEENPSISTIENGTTIAQECNTDLVIGIGGGSSMDAAKGIALLVQNPLSLNKYLSGHKVEKDTLPIICIPTTSGTGSEVTPYAVFSDHEDQSKKAVAHKKLFPIISFLDPELTYSMPKNVIISTGLDAFTHSVEAYLSNLSFDLNDQLALNSIKTIIDNLEKASKHKEAAMDKMAYASMLAGISITHASTILPHIMGYPLTVFHNIPHGLANAILLPAFIDYLKENNLVAEKIKKLHKLFSEVGGIKYFINNLGISTKLSDYGVQQKELSGYVEKVIHKSDIEITPGNITEDVIQNLYLNSF